METKEFRTSLSHNSSNHRFVSKSMGIGQEIIAALERKGMTQRELAEQLGCKETLVSRWLGGLQNFTLRTIAHIEEVLEQDLLLTSRQAAEKYRKQAKVVVREVMMVEAVNAHLRDMPSQESYSVGVRVTRNHQIRPDRAVGTNKNTTPAKWSYAYAD